MKITDEDIITMFELRDKICLACKSNAICVLQDLEPCYLVKVIDKAIDSMQNIMIGVKND